MKIVLASICASYIHTPLALYALRSYCSGYEDNIIIKPFNLSQKHSQILQGIYKETPNIIGFSCYIWNIDKTAQIAGSIKKILPNALIVFGGPEVYGDYDSYLLSKTTDIVIRGEGEAPFYQLVDQYANNSLDLASINGIAYMYDGKIIKTPPPKPLDLKSLPFPYNNGLSEVKDKIIYYEGSRGCIASCSYCISSVSGSYRTRPMEDIFIHLDYFLSHKVKQVKFIDRTFNQDSQYAIDIWQYLIIRDNGITNFHFEIAGDLLSAQELELLAKARPGLFQFEIGVQSTNEATLDAINRKMDLKKLFDNVKTLKTYNNIHLHLDLIAGLPGEAYESCKKSFNDVYESSPDHIQLGFLKLLKGTPLKKDAASLGIVSSGYPPYEVLCNRQLKYDDILSLKSIAEMVELFYNTQILPWTVKYLITLYTSPFDFYCDLAVFMEGRGYVDKSVGRRQLYGLMYDFSLNSVKCGADLRDLIQLDFYESGGERGARCVLEAALPDHRQKMMKAYMKGKDSWANSIVFFETDVLLWIRDLIEPPVKREHYLLFSNIPGQKKRMVAEVEIQ